MATVCFTGAGKRYGIQTFTRPQWQHLAITRGHTPHEHVYWNTDYLVASRHDTSKARTAQRNGTTVLTYEQWEEMLATGDTTVPAFAPTRPISPGAAQPRFIPPSSADRRAAAQALAAMDDTPPEPSVRFGERVRKINI
jgi:hypothetical protein